MKKIFSAGVLVLLVTIGSQAQTLESVTSNGYNSTTNLIRISGVGNIPAAGAGLELYYSNGQGYVQSRNRDGNVNTVLNLAGSTINTTSRTLINFAADDGLTALQVNGAGLFSGKVTLINGHDFRALSNGIDTRLGSDAFITGVGGAGTVSAHPFIIATNASERLRVTAGGDVAIGTNDPHGYKLAVAGRMIAESVKVKLQSAWPDYVFRDNYALPALPELEAYIAAHQHLPHLPSAGEVEKNGLDLGEMNKLLLQKIEELTLYLIAEHKKNAELSARLDRLEKDR